MKEKIIITAMTAGLIASTVFVLLDTFVIERAVTKVNNSVNLTSSSVASLAGSSSSNSQINVTTYRQNNTTIYVADIYLADGQTIQSALANNTYGRNITDTTSNIAASVNATIAINGDYYGARTSGYVIRNGQLLQTTKASDDQEDMVIWADGSMTIIREGDISAQELLDQGAMQVLTFGPGLIIDGTISVDSNDEVGRAMANNPRTAIGYLGNNHYVFVVADGRTSESTGLSLLQLAEFMASLGCQQAYNLDGGGSSTMYYNGKVINNPTTNGSKISERKVSDILYVK